MKNGYFITMGVWGVSYVYYPKIDKLYGLLEKGALEEPKYKSIPYSYKKIMGGLFTSLILFLFYHTPYVKLIFSLELWNCIAITMISCFFYKITVIEKKIENFSKIKLIEIPFEETTTGHYNAIKNHTKIIFSIDIIGYMMIVFCWVYRYEILNDIGETAIPLILLLFVLFIIAGVFLAISAPIGRFKLIRRIRQEKRKLKKKK